MVKKLFDQRRSFGLSFAAVVLALLLLLSTCVVALTSSVFKADAAITDWAVAGDFNSWSTTANTFSGGSGSITISISGRSSITFKMVAKENGDQWCGNDTGLLTSGSTYELGWNTGGDMQLLIPDNQADVTFTISVSNGKNYLTATAVSTAGGGGGGGELPSSDWIFDAPVNTSNSANTDSSKIFWAKATYFDYLSDEEYGNTQWLKPVQAGTKNFNGANDEWFPFYTFNREVVKAQADLPANSTWSYPLYFGNFCDTANAYDTPHHQNGYDSYGYREATQTSQVTRFWHHVNNSDISVNGYNALGSMYESVQGLMGSTLSSSGDLLLPSGQQAPYFNSSESSPLKGYAKVVNSSFPFTVSEKNGYTFYKFNSAKENNRENDSVYFTWDSNGKKTWPTGVNYGSGSTYGVLDGVSRFMNGGTSGYGIFPFNNASGNYKGVKTNANENLNYGFGIKIEMNFRVPKPSATVNTTANPIQFEFSGDDDLWMYITNNRTKQSQLVLDMGGDHKMSTGRVNFNTRRSTVDNVYYKQGAVTTPAAPAQFDFNYDDTYTMTVFYMERGLIESNCEMSFTMSPAGNQVKVDKVVDVDSAGINTDALKAAVKTEAAKDTFGFIAYDDGTAKANTTYHYNGSTPVTANDGTFTLKDGENAAFLSQFTINKDVYVSETGKGTRFDYNTRWSVADPQKSSRNTSGSGDTAGTLTLKNPNGTTYDFAELDYTFTNTPKVGSVSLTKTITGKPSDTKEFNATVEVSVDGGTTYSVYPLAYTASDKPGQTFNLNGRGQLSSSALLKQGRTLTFSGLPSKAKVRVTENFDAAAAASYSFSSVNANGSTIIQDGTGGVMTVPSTGSTLNMQITNTPVQPGSVDVYLNAYKVLSSNSGVKLPSSSGKTDFVFQLRKGSEASSPIQEIYYTSLVGNSRAAVSFNKITYSAEATDVYYITEKAGSDSDLTYSTDVYRVTVRVTRNAATNTLSATKTYAKKTAGGAWTTISTESGVTFTNTLKTGSVKVVKTSQHKDGSGNYDEELSEVEYVLYRVDRRGDVPIDEVDSQTTNLEGEAVFTNLALYKENATYDSDPDERDYQWYCLVEESSDGKHNLSSHRTYFFLPEYDDDDNPVYNITYTFQNGNIFPPDAGFGGMKVFKTVGVSLMAVSAAFGIGFGLYKAKGFARRRKRK